MAKLFEETEINGMVLANRFVRSATYDGMAEKNGHVSTKQIQMVEELARGGVGLIILGITYVHPSGQISPVQNSLADDACIPGFRMLADTAHRYGSRIAVQLFHAGRETAKVFKPNRKQALAPSSISDDPHFRGPHRAMTEEEILEVIRAFGQGAGRDLGADDGDGPHRIEQRELLDGQAVVKKEDGENRVIEPRVEKNPEEDKQADVGDCKRRGQCRHGRSR